MSVEQTILIQCRLKKWPWYKYYQCSLSHRLRTKSSLLRGQVAAAFPSLTYPIPSAALSGQWLSFQDMLFLVCDCTIAFTSSIDNYNSYLSITVYVIPNTVRSQHNILMVVLAVTPDTHIYRIDLQGVYVRFHGQEGTIRAVSKRSRQR